jgi:hypothetical protein
LRPLQRQLLLGVPRPGPPRRLGVAKQLQRLAEHARLDLRFLVALLRLLDQVGDALLEAVEVGEHQLGLDDFSVRDRIDPPLDMGDVAALEAAQHMDDGLDLPDVGEELVAQPFALRGAAHQAGDVDEFELGLDLLRRLGEAGDLVEPRVGHRNPPDIGLDRAEGIVRRLRRRRLSQRIEQGRLADVRQPNDPAAKTHGLKHSVRPEPVEGLLFLEMGGFDRLSPNGC